MFYARDDNKIPYSEHNRSRNKVVVTQFCGPETGENKDEKNWSPFLFDVEGENKTKSILFVRSINPLVIVRALWSKASTTPGSQDRGVVPVETVSSAKPVSMKFWSYGTLRGGTNPVLIHNLGNKGQDPFYLAIFHSVSTIPGDGVFSPTPWERTFLQKCVPAHGSVRYRS